MIRAFLALPMPPDLAESLTRVQFLLPLPRRTDPEDFHLTLHFLGELRDPLLEAVHEAWQALRAPPLTITLQGLGLFGGDKPRVAFASVAENPALRALQARVQRAAIMAGAEAPAQKFTPHVTLGRIPRIAAPDLFRLERAIAEGAAFAPPPFTVHEMVLYESRPAASGPKYRPLAHYPLGG